ncbi:MAG: class I SAM-dependent methyltransferase [Pseudomonadales bacterium]
MQLANPFANAFGNALGKGAGLHAMRARTAAYARQIALDRCLRRLAGGDPDTLPAGLVTELYAHWGDPLDEPGEGFLRSCLAELKLADGPVLQCGAGVLTLLLGAICGRDAKRHLWCFEQDPQWSNVMRSWLTQYEIANAHVITAPARMYPTFVWYAMDLNRVPKGLRLLLCEGSRATPRGAVGALEMLTDHLAPNCTVLARRVTSKDDLAYLKDWAGRHGAALVMVDKREGFIKLSRRAGGTHKPH